MMAELTGSKILMAGIAGPMALIDGPTVPTMLIDGQTGPGLMDCADRVGGVDGWAGRTSGIDGWAGSRRGNASRGGLACAPGAVHRGTCEGGSVIAALRTGARWSAVHDASRSVHLPGGGASARRGDGPPTAVPTNRWGVIATGPIRRPRLLTSSRGGGRSTRGPQRTRLGSGRNPIRGDPCG